MVEATLVVSGHMGGRHAKHWHCAIYAPDPNANLIPIPEELWQVYTEDRDMTRGIRTRKIADEGDALFYLTDARGQLVFWGSTQMFRLPFGRSALDFVPDWLRQEQDLDLAEAIFGYVKSEAVPYGKLRAYAGRVFVEDARALPSQDKLVEGEDVTPQILGGPKPNTFQHYLTQPDGAARDKLQLKHYASSTPGEAVVRGHKQYWHRQIKDRTDFEWKGSGEERSDAKKQLTGIKPVRAGVAFTFRVRFENLSDVELGALLWALALPDGCAHKLGMGKPLGLGSVRVTVQSLHLTDRKQRYGKLWADEAWATGEGQGKSVADYKTAFEQYVLQHVDAAERASAQTLAEIPRVHELLCLLSFVSAPPIEETRYLEIEHEENGNEYKERPVLPLPSVVAQKEQSGAMSATPPVNTPPVSTQSNKPTQTGPAANWRTGAIAEMRPDKHYGKVRDMQTNSVYRFDTSVIQGDYPAVRATVLFDLQGDTVRTIKRR